MGQPKDISGAGDDALFFAKAMREAAGLKDGEECHARMDDLMCKKLSELGYHEGVKIFQAAEKWYA